MSDINPYSGRGSPVSGSRLVGRKTTLARLIERVNSESHCSVVGLPRMGKTSIVREAVRQSQSNNPDLVWGYITLDAISGPIQAYTRILNEIEALDDGNFAIDLSKSHDDVYEYFLRILRKNKRMGKRTVIIIDEMDAIVRDGFPDAQVFVSRIREVANDRDRYGLTFIFVSRRSLDMIQGVVDTSTLAGLCEVIYLPPLDKIGLQELILRSAYSVHIDMQVVNTLWELTGGHPFLSEVVMCEVIEISKSVLNAELIEEAQHTQAHEFTNQYRQLENLLSQNDMFASLCELVVGPHWRNITPHTIALLKHYGLIKNTSDSSRDCMSSHFKYYLESVNRLTPSWVLLGETEKSLRYFIQDRMVSKYGYNWIDMLKNKDLKKFEQLNELMMRDKKLFGDTASDFLLDYTYIGDLKDLIFAEWDLCRSQLGGTKSEWEGKFQHIMKVRNPMAHHRMMPDDVLQDAEESCRYILSKLR
jgi:hypothetical protein